MLLCVLITSSVFGHSKEEYFNNVVKAIYVAEGGSKAKYAYGIESVKYSSIAEARTICHNSVVNNYARWIKAGKPGDFISFMAKRYCPYNQRVWTKNVQAGLKRFDKKPR